MVPAAGGMVWSVPVPVPYHINYLLLPTSIMVPAVPGAAAAAGGTTTTTTTGTSTGTTCCWYLPPADSSTKKLSTTLVKLSLLKNAITDYAGMAPYPGMVPYHTYIHRKNAIVPVL